VIVAAADHGHVFAASVMAGKPAFFELWKNWRKFSITPLGGSAC